MRVQVAALFLNIITSLSTPMGPLLRPCTRRLAPANDFTGEERHVRTARQSWLRDGTRAPKKGAHGSRQDVEVFGAIRREIEKQQGTLNLIASENYVSAAVREAQGSVLTNKYAEGYPGKRWYGGCEYVDDVERLAIDRAKELFGAEHANVQPHSGSRRTWPCTSPPSSRRHDPGHEPGPRRPPDARPPRQLLGPAVRRGVLRRRAGHRADRLRRSARLAERAQAEADRGGRQRLLRACSISRGSARSPTAWAPC